MQDTAVKKTVSKNLFRGNFSIHATAQYSIPAAQAHGSAAIFFERLVKGFGDLLQLPPRDDGTSALSNLRGRAPETLGSSAAGANAGEELFYLRGAFLDTSEHHKTAERTHGPAPDIACSYTLRSHFKEFHRGSAIIHDVRQHLQSDIREQLREVTPMLLTRLLPFRIDRGRFGFECFKNRYFGALLGFTPDLYGHCYVEYNAGTFAIDLLDERAPAAESLPIASLHAAEVIDAALKHAHVARDFLEQLTATQSE